MLVQSCVGKEKWFSYLAIFTLGVKQCHPNKKMAFVSMKRKSSWNKPFAFWRLSLFSLPIEFLIAWYILSDTSPSGHKGNLEGLRSSRTLAVTMFALAEPLPLVYRAIVNTSFAFPACRESWLHVALRYGNFSVLRLNLHLTSPSNHTERVCVSFVWLIFSPFSFWKVPWLVDLEKPGFELQQVLTSGCRAALFSGMLSCW